MAEAVIVNEMLTIQSNDGIQIEVELKLAQCFGKIRSVLDEMQTRQVGTDRITVVLDDVTGDILGKLLVWAEKHKDDTNVEDEEVTSTSSPPESNDSSPEGVDEWDKEFFRTNFDHLAVMMTAADDIGLDGFSGMAEKVIASGLDDDIEAGETDNPTRSWSTLAVCSYHASTLHDDDDHDDAEEDEWV